MNHLGLREKTVFIYTADNGTNRSLTYPFNGAYYKGEKAYATEGGYHVPLIVNCPTVVPSGIVNNDLIDFSDVLPTLAELTGAKLPKVKLDGRSFWPQCLGKEGDPTFLSPCIPRRDEGFSGGSLRGSWGPCWDIMGLC